MLETIVYIVRHATSLPRQDVTNDEWELSSYGRQQADALVEAFESLNIDVVVSSPYPRAVDTVFPFTQKKDILLQSEDGLRDQNMEEETLPPADFQSLTRAMWNDFEHSKDGSESNGVCQRRMVKVIKDICHDNEGKTVLVCSHAGPIAMFMKALDPSFTYDDWANMAMPHMYKIFYNGENFRVDAGFVTPIV